MHSCSHPPHPPSPPEVGIEAHCTYSTRQDRQMTRVRSPQGTELSQARLFVGIPKGRQGPLYNTEQLRSQQT